MQANHTPFVIPGTDVAMVPLSRHLFALIDAADISIVAPHRWYAAISGTTFYARAKIDGADVYMHRLIAEVPAGFIADHISGHTLDNRRSNLRVVTHSQNSQNGLRHRDNQTGFRGIELHRKSGLFMARICVQRKRHLIGYFHTAEEAARAYDDRARELHGEFARLNFPEEGERAA